MSVDVKVSPNFRRWINGFEGMAGGDFAKEAVNEWTLATASLFDRSQDYVHVWHINGGTLKRSGSYKVEATRRGVVGTVTYSADYAIYEHARGGSHAYLTRAWTATRSEFEDALTRAFERTVNSWN